MAASTQTINTITGLINPILFDSNINVVEWYTPKLNSGSLYGIAVGHIRVAESNIAANATIRLEISVADQGGTYPLIWGASSANVGISTTESEILVYVAGPYTIIPEKSRILFRLSITNFEAQMNAGHTVTLYYNSATPNISGDTYVVLPNTFTEYTGETGLNYLSVLPNITNTAQFQLSQNINDGSFTKGIRE